MDLPRVLGRLRPGCNPIYADSHASLLSEIIEWRDELGRTVPTQQECDAEWVLCQQEDAALAAVEAVEAGAETQASAIPGWATWDAATANAWAQTNLTNVQTQIRADAVAATTLAAMKPVIIDLIDLVGVLIDVTLKLGRMVIALRNAQWPNLENS